METRSIEECKALAEKWYCGDQDSKEAVIEELGGEPTEEFLSYFGHRALATAAGKALRADLASESETRKLFKVTEIEEPIPEKIDKRTKAYREGKSNG